MSKIMTKILQGSIVTQTVLAGLTIYHPLANSAWYISAKIMKIGWQ